MAWPITIPAGILPDIPFDVCPNPQQQIFRSPDYTPGGVESVPTNSLVGLVTLITLMLGVAGIAIRTRTMG